MLTNQLTGEEINDDQLSSVANLVEKQLELQRYVNELEEDLKQAKEQLDLVSKKLLPDAMQELGLGSLTTKDGAKLTITPFYAAHISDDNREAAHAWLRKTGNDGIIKTNVTVAFNKGQMAEAEAAMRVLRKHKFTEAQLIESIHHSTLKAFVKEQIENGSAIPQDLFGVFVGNIAKIKI